MEFKGTKGEWKINISPVTNGWVDVYFPDGNATIRTNDYIRDEKDCGNKELMKNTIIHAKLISAAPELLEALQIYIGQIDRGPNKFSWLEKRRIAEKAIEKALK